MKLAAVQYRPPHGRPARARRDLVRLAHAAVDAGARLVVLPELATTGYVFEGPAEIGPHCEPAEGPTLEALRPVAARGACVVCGFAERGADGALFNSALVLGPDGRLQATYRKVLLYPLDERWARPGDRRLLLDLACGRLAPAICMDINDDRFISWLGMVGPELLAFCTNWVQEDEVDPHSWWRHQLRGYSGWFLAANRWGEERGVRFSGRSAILAPHGRVVAQAEAEGDGVVLADTAEWSSGEDTSSTQGQAERWGGPA